MLLNLKVREWSSCYERTQGTIYWFAILRSLHIAKLNKKTKRRTGWQRLILSLISLTRLLGVSPMSILHEKPGKTFVDDNGKLFSILFIMGYWG